MIKFHILLAIYAVHEVLMASILGWFAIPSSSGSHFVRTLHYDLVHLGWPCMAWLIASLNSASLFAMTRLLSMKGIQLMYPLNYPIFHNLQDICLSPNLSLFSWPLETYLLLPTPKSLPLY